MNDVDACAGARWGTVSGLDPELVAELRRAKEARALRESEALDLAALEEVATKRDHLRWLKRMAAALGLITVGSIEE